MTKYVLYAAVFLYALLIPIPNNAYVDTESRLLLYNTRPYMAVALLGLVVLFGLANQQERMIAVFSNGSLTNVFLLGAIYPLYYFVVSFSRPQPNIGVVGLYFTWWLFSFLAVPLLVQRSQEFAQIIRVLVGASMVAFLLAVFLTATADVQPFGLPDRTSFGFFNPHYYAQVVQVLLAIFVYYAAHQKSAYTGKEAGLFWTYAALVVGCMLLVWLARSRNAMFFIVGFFLSYWFLMRGGRYVYHLLFLSLCVFVMIFVLAQAYGEAYLDELSTGRLTMWKYVFRAVLWSESPLTNLLFGPPEFPQVEFVFSYDELRSEKAFQKAHIDNFYIELILEGGIVGFALFMLPYLYIVKRGFDRLKESGLDRKQIAWPLSVFFGCMVQGLFISTFPGFGNPLAFFFAFAIMMPWLFREAPGSVPAVVYDRVPSHWRRAQYN